MRFRSTKVRRYHSTSCSLSHPAAMPDAMIDPMLVPLQRSIGSEAESVDANRRAAELAGDIRGIDDSDWATIGLLGLYYSHLGRTKDALRLVDSSVNMSQRNSEALYYQALARLETGDDNGALEAVATDEQYRQFIETDPDLQSLRLYNRFALLLPGAAELSIRPQA